MGLESAGLPVPGETALIAAAGLAAAGHLSAPLVIAVAAAAAIAGDTAGYGLGRRAGRALLTRGRWLRAHRLRAIARTDRFFARYGPATVFFGRWIPGVRVVVAVLPGAARMPWRHFAPANAAGAIIWAGAITLLASTVGTAATFGLAACALLAGPVAGLIGWARVARRARDVRPHGARALR